MSVLARCLLSLFLICKWSTRDVAAGIACDTTPVYEDITPPATRNLVCMPVKSSSSQLRRQTGGKDWHGLCYWWLLFSYGNSITGSARSYSYCMSQVVRRHMRTRLQPAQLMKINLWLSLSANQHSNPSWVIGIEYMPWLDSWLIRLTGHALPAIHWVYRGPRTMILGLLCRRH